MFCRTESLALLLACSQIFCQKKGFCSYKIVLIKKSVQSLMEDFSCNTIVNGDFSCNTQSTECMHSTCVNCSDLELNMNDFHNNKESITFHQWIRVDNKIQKSEIESPCERHQSLEKTYLYKTSTTYVL